MIASYRVAVPAAFLLAGLAIFSDANPGHAQGIGPTRVTPQTAPSPATPVPPAPIPDRPVPPAEIPNVPAPPGAVLNAPVSAPPSAAAPTVEPAPADQPAAPAVEPATGVAITWTVVNRFRLFRDERDFRRHAEAAQGR